MSTTNDVVLQQLGEIQRSLGTVVGTLEGVKEDVKSQAADSINYRDNITSGLNNALTRIAALETGLKEIKLEISKTVRPLVRQSNNMTQRVVGFMAAVSLAGVVFSGLFWLVSGGFDVVVRVLSGLKGLP